MNEKDRIDKVLDKNAAKQLEKMNWDRLAKEISDRLDKAQQMKVSPRSPSVAGLELSRGPSFFKAAAGMAAAAAIIFVAVVFRVNEPSNMQMPGDTAAENADTKPVASIQIKDTAGKALVKIHVGRTDKEAAKCIVDIIDHRGDLEEGNRAAWIIINAAKRALADNGHDKEEADLMCLL
jgi:hypothetical protein